jgi:hypothetical protein
MLILQKVNIVGSLQFEFLIAYGRISKGNGDYNEAIKDQFHGKVFKTSG